MKKNYDFLINFVEIFHDLPWFSAIRIRFIRADPDPASKMKLIQTDPDPKHCSKHFEEDCS